MNSERPVALLRPRVDGLLDADGPLLLPIMASRLQGDFNPAGTLKLALWGSGDLATIRFAPLTSPCVYGPNGISAARGGLFVAQSAPSLVIRGARLASVRAARKCAWWHKQGNFEARRTTTETVREVSVPWGAVITEQRGDDLVVC